MTSRLAIVVDRAAAILLGGFLIRVLATATFGHTEHYDFVAYALPGANLVERGVLALPQLGPQLNLDRHYLLHSPVMVLGPVPWYWLLGTGRMAYLIGVFAIGIASVIGCTRALGRLLKLESLALAVILAGLFLANRITLSEFYNQRYSSAVFGLLLLAFFPVGEPGQRRRPWWQWLAAGSLPLFHPALVPALLIWAFDAALAWSRPFKPEATSGRAAGWLGPLLFLSSLALSLAWFGRPEPFRGQFLPHLGFGNFRATERFRALASPSSVLASLPTLAANVAIAVLALVIVVVAVKRPWRPRLAPIVGAAAAIVAAVALDAWRGFPYVHFYLMGIGPCLFVVFRDRGRRPFLLGAGALAVVTWLVSARVDRAPPNLVDTPEALAFLVEHTRPGDRIVAGPPFVLPTASPTLPGGRSAPRVSPQVYYLKTFDEPRFRREIREQTFVYIGDPRWYRRPVWTNPEGEPLFAEAEIQEFRFRAEPVIVARARSSGTSTPAPPSRPGR